MANKKQYQADYVSPLQLTMFAPHSDWRPTPVVDLPDWGDAERVGIDVETKDPSIQERLGPGVRRGGYVVGVSVTIEGGPSHYVPFRHEGGDNVPEDEALRYLRDNAKRFKGEYVGARLDYDLDYLWEEGIESPEATYRDIQIADPLIYELHDSFSLKNIGERFGIASKEQTLLEEAAKAHGVSPKGGLWRLPARYVGLYAETDTRSPLEIYAKQRERLNSDNLWEVWDLESRVLPVLVRMRRRGVRIDEDKLTKIEEWSLQQEAEALRVVKHETGVSIGVGNVWKPNEIAKAIEFSGIRLGRTGQGAPQIDKALFEANRNKVTDAIAWARKVNKLRTTFAQSIRTYMTNGRIHCTFNQIARETEGGDQKGARYGRLSAVDPNLQQQPARDEFADMWRSIYLAEPGAVFGVKDYSQQEPRWTTHFAALMGYDRADEAARRYRENPDTDNHDMMTRLIYGDASVEAMLRDDYKAARTRSKIIFLGLCYGEGGAKLCHDLQLPTRWALATGRGNDRRIEYFGHQHEAYHKKADIGHGYVFEAAGEEGQSIIDQFNKEVPYVSALAARVKREATNRGWIKTISGRRLHFPQRDDGGFDWTHKALNRLIQGSSADQTKHALVQLDAAGYYLQLQVHDEIDGSYESPSKVKEAARIMRECIRDITEPKVPFLVDADAGPSWGEVEVIK